MTTKKENKKITCGIIMPISSIDGCSAEHWLEVKDIIFESVQSVGDKNFVPRIVSDADDVGVIQKRIVQSLYDSEIVVCDVSGKNPNVMFELGMRLAFDKPTVIIKDDQTDYSFDTGVIEHLTYPRDLRFSKIVEFKESLAKKIEATHNAGEKNQNSFLKNFGKFQVAQLDETVVSADKAVLESLSDMQREISHLRRNVGMEYKPFANRDPSFAGDFSGLEKRRLIRSAIEKWKRQNPEVKDKDLSDNKELHKFVEKEIRAPAVFTTPAEFDALLNRVLRFYKDFD